MNEEVYLDDITGYIGEWMERGFEESVPREVIKYLELAYKKCVERMSYGG